MDELNETSKADKFKLALKNILYRKSFWQRIIFLALIGVLIGLVTISPRVQTAYAAYLFSNAETWSIDFSAVFDEENLSAWQPTDGEVNENITNMATSKNHLEVEFAPTGETTVRDAFYNQSASASEDFLLTMKIEPPGSCHAGPIFRGNANGEYYLFLVSNDSYTAEILRRESNKDLPREALILNSPFPEDLGKPFKLNVLAHKNNYYFYINDVFVDKISDKRLKGEQTGIELFVCQGISSESIFQIEQFTIRKPDNVN